MSPRRAAFPVLLAWGLCAVLAACGGSSETPPATPGQRSQTEGPGPGSAELSGEPELLRPGAALLLGVPIHDGDFADPYVLRSGDAFYTYSTNTKDANVPLLVVRNSTTARYAGDVLPQVAEWSEPGFVWAPAVLANDEDYVLYYSTRAAGTETQCISRAVAEHPEGPFVDDSTQPFVCQRDLGGSIDPSVVVDRAGERHLLYKNDGNCCGIPTSIWSQPLSEDGLALTGGPSRLLTAQPGWEGELIEGPSMVATDDDYLLFYSANAWDTADYAIGLARCANPSGPCQRVGDGPWMDSSAFAHGPGGQEFFEALDDVWMTHHAWRNGDGAASGAQRRLYVDIVEFDDGLPKRVGARNSGLVVMALVIGMALLVAAVISAVVWRRRRTGQVPGDQAGASVDGDRDL